MSFHCIVWYCMVLYYILRYCMLLHCWLRRAGCISQDTYLLYCIILYSWIKVARPHPRWFHPTDSECLKGSVTLGWLCWCLLTTNCFDGHKSFLRSVTHVRPLRWLKLALILALPCLVFIPNQSCEYVRKILYKTVLDITLYLVQPGSGNRDLTLPLPWLVHNSTKSCEYLAVVIVFIPPCTRGPLVQPGSHLVPRLVRPGRNNRDT